MSRDKGLIGIIGQGIGLAAEYRQHRKRQDSSLAGSSRQPDDEDATPSNAVTDRRSQSPLEVRQRTISDEKTTVHQRGDEKNVAYDDDSLYFVEDDEADWQLDEAGHSDTPPAYEEIETGSRNNDDLVREVVNTNLTQITVPPPSFVRTSLPCPVIIPQRRPGSKGRGFVRAYAPLLGECAGIDQDTFLTFLKNFHKSSKASPVFTVIQISAAIAGFAPSITAQIVSVSVGAAAKVGGDIHSRARTNNFLDKMNEELFKPAGLYAMIIRYKSDSELAASANSPLARFGFTSETVDLNTTKTIAKCADKTYDGSQSMSSRMQNLRVASGTASAMSMPEAAPLVFPEIDDSLAQEGPQTFKHKAKDFKKFLAGYMDRRAQMKYAQDNPDSTLILPEEQRAMKSTFADPSHPMYRNGLIGFVSGGKLTPDRMRSFDGKQRSPTRDVRTLRDGESSGGEYGTYANTYEHDQRRKSSCSGRRCSSRSHDRVQQALEMYQGRRGTAFDECRRYSERSGSPYDGRRSPPSRSSGSASGLVDGLVRTATDRLGNAGAAGLPVHHQHPMDLIDQSIGGVKSGRTGGGASGMVKRAMKEGVLYLMIVNMPSEAELAEARKQSTRTRFSG